MMVLGVTMKITSLALAASFVLPASTVFAGESWDEIRPEIYGERDITDAGDMLSLTAPYRAELDTEVPIEVAAKFADGRTVKSLSIIIDDNPAPVSAVFDMEAPESSFSILANMRINGPTPVRAVVEASDGELYMTETFVKTSGLGACAAPPITGVEAALASLGKMKLFPVAKPNAEGSILAELTTVAAAQEPVSSKAASKRVRLEMKHPSHSGMQRDQISLLYILARYVETVEVWTDEDKLFTMTGSISLSEDPEIEFTYSSPQVEAIKVRMTDTEETISEEVFPLGES